MPNFDTPGQFNTAIGYRVLLHYPYPWAEAEFQKDVITIFPTDATNGQMITSWSHQNKPLGGNEVYDRVESPKEPIEENIKQIRAITIKRRLE